MFNGTITIIKRGKILHCGTRLRHDTDNLFSICNGIWNIKDKINNGLVNEVTCKRCLKLLQKADENGKIKL